MTQSEKTQFIPAWQLRAAFCEGMSQMYRQEVPAYGTLIDIVERANVAAAGASDAFKQILHKDGGLDRVSAERHGAIRLGTAAELSFMRRLFAVFGMFPVGYYDLGPSGIPVHSTAFRPITREELDKNPFRVFTSLLRLDAIEDVALRDKARDILSQRQIFSDALMDLVQTIEAQGGVTADQMEALIQEAINVFRWHSDALVDKATYDDLHDAHRLIADVVSFKGPHINHLTPRALDIDAVQVMMQAEGLPAKEVIEGPPTRTCPILLRQTSFHALHEPIRFLDGVDGGHTARFGEIEQRGVALTPKGRALYDTCLNEARANKALPYTEALSAAFARFPDDWATLQAEGLAYFYNNDPARPVIYEDFLPVSAAGIFKSNLGGGDSGAEELIGSQKEFESALGVQVFDSFSLYNSAAQGEPA